MTRHIVSLYLENFEGHSKTKIELAPGGQLSVIVGASDCGKTSLIRALRWVLYNIPQGTAFIRAGTSSAAVVITYDDATKVVRERGRSYNRYRLLLPGQAEQTFEGFGGDVPLEVQEVTGVRPASIGDLSLNLNLSEQLDGPFLGSKSVSSGARAKVLGKLAGTEEVDKAATSLGTDLYRATQEEKRLTTEINEIGKQIDAYAYLPRLVQHINQAESILAAVRAAEHRKDLLVTIEAKLQIVHKRQAEARAVVEKWAVLGVLEPMATSLEELVQRGGALARHRTRLAILRDNRHEALQMAAQWTHLDQLEHLRDTTTEKLRRHDHLYLLQNRLVAIATNKQASHTTLTRLAGLGRAADIMEHLSLQADRGRRLMQLRARLRPVQEGIAQQRQTMKALGDVASADGIMVALQPMVERRTTLTLHSQKLAQIHGDRIVAENRLRELSNMIADAQSAYTDTLVQSGVCPVCGSKIDPQRVKEVA